MSQTPHSPSLSEARLATLAEIGEERTANAGDVQPGGERPDLIQQARCTRQSARPRSHGDDHRRPQTSTTGVRG